MEWYLVAGWLTLPLSTRTSSENGLEHENISALLDFGGAARREREYVGGGLQHESGSGSCSSGAESWDVVLELSV